MQRNFQTPTWQVPNYSKTVVESLGLGTVILTVNATDADPLVGIAVTEMDHPVLYTSTCIIHKCHHTVFYIKFYIDNIAPTQYGTILHHS